MKKILDIALTYILVCVFGTFVLSALFMFNADMLSYVTDVPSKLFSLNSFLAGICVSFPLAVSLALFAVALVMVKKRENQIFSLVVFIFLGALTWLCLIPLSLNFLNGLESKNQNLVSRKNETSAEIFRESMNGVFYNSRVLEDGNVDGIFIDTSDFENSRRVISFYDLPVNNEKAYPYSDVIVKNALEPPKHVTYPVAVYVSLLTAAENSSRNGILSWIFFASFGLALLSCYGLQYLSSWRLCSALFTAIGEIFIVFVNYFYYMGFFPAGLKELESSVSKIIPAENSLIFAVNFVIAAVLVIFGIVMGIYRNHKAQKNQNGEIQ